MNAYFSPSFATLRYSSRFGHAISTRKILKGFFAQCVVALSLAFALLLPAAWPSLARAQDAAPALFPHIRALTLDRSRQLAAQRSTGLALAGAKLAQAEATRREVESRIKLNTTGGLDPFSQQIRFYVALDLERLLGLNRQEKARARQAVAAEKLGQQNAQADAMKRVTSAWYAMVTANAGVVAATRRREAAQALYIAADARFKAGQGELGNVLAALQSTYTSDDAFEASRQQVALSCLELAQACGYATAEEMEAAL